MNESWLLVLLAVGMILALAIGIWVGLGYPGVYAKYESTGTKAPRRTPLQMLMDWLVRKMDR